MSTKKPYTVVLAVPEIAGRKRVPVGTTLELTAAEAEFEMLRGVIAEPEPAMPEPERPAKKR